jgi:hypothetical protein
MSVSENKNERPVETRSPGLSRRSFFEHVSLAGTATAWGFSRWPVPCAPWPIKQNPGHDPIKDAIATNSDVDILSGAAIAGALAVATYTGIVSDSGWTSRCRRSFSNSPLESLECCTIRTLADEHQIQYEVGQFRVNPESRVQLSP